MQGYQTSPSQSSTHVRPRTLQHRDHWRAMISRNGTVGAVEVPGPFGPVYLTPRQHMLMVWIGRGRRITQRQGLVVTGYSLSGFHRALVQLQRLGLVGHRTRRGRYGFTALWRNVRTMSRRGATSSHLFTLLLPRRGHGANIGPDPGAGEAGARPPGPSFAAAMAAAGFRPFDTIGA